MGLNLDLEDLYVSIHVKLSTCEYDYLNLFHTLKCSGLDAKGKPMAPGQ